MPYLITIYRVAKIRLDPDTFKNKEGRQDIRVYLWLWILFLGALSQGPRRSAGHA